MDVSKPRAGTKNGVLQSIIVAVWIDPWIVKRLSRWKLPTQMIVVMHFLLAALVIFVMTRLSWVQVADLGHTSCCCTSVATITIISARETFNNSFTPRAAVAKFHSTWGNRSWWSWSRMYHVDQDFIVCYINTIWLIFRKLSSDGTIFNWACL